MSRTSMARLARTSTVNFDEVRTSQRRSVHWSRGAQVRKAWEKEQQRKSAAQIEAESRSAEAAARALMAEVARAQAAGLSAEELEADEVIPPPPPSGELQLPAGWQPDPSGRHELRYWDGSTWSAHVSNSGVVAQDPMA